MSQWPRFNHNRAGLFLICLCLEGGRRVSPPPPLLTLLFVDLSKRNFVHGLPIKALAQIWKIDNDVIIVRNLPEKTVKRV